LVTLFFFVSLYFVFENGNCQSVIPFCFCAMKYLVPIVCLSITLSSCYKEVSNMEPDADKFNLLVSAEKQKFIYDSRDTSYSIDDPELKLYFNDQLVELDEIRVRGKSALRFQRKSYTVFLDIPVFVTDRYGADAKRLKRFKLLALAQDYTYIENRIAFGILEAAGIMPLFFKFVEFRINDETQGVYLLIEDPEQYYHENGSEFILRRGYDHRIDDSDYEPSDHLIPVEVYENRFREIYNNLNRHEGANLFHEIESRLSLSDYFRKMGIDYLLRNGDYTDEIYLYAMVNRDTIRYDLIPWDYDDIFEKYPHEVGRSWGMGNSFGTRYYDSQADIYDDIGEKLVFSIEDDLDYAIAKDPYLYQLYEDELLVLFEELDEVVIERIFKESEDELSTFYNSINVIEQSIYDQDISTRALWIKNMSDKQAMIKERLSSMKERLNGVKK